MTVDCDSLFLEIEQNVLNETWIELEEDLGSMFSVYNLDDFVNGIQITVYIAIGLLILNLLYYCTVKGIKRETLPLSVKDEKLEMTVTKSPKPTEIRENIKNKVLNKKKLSINSRAMCAMMELIAIYIGIATLLIILYIPGYFIGAHIHDSYNSYVEVGCIAFNCTETRKYDDGVMYEDYNISACYNCLDDAYEYNGCVIWKFDIDSLCTNNTSYVDTEFYGRFVSPNWNHWDNQKCFINKNNFKVRSGGVDCGCACNTPYCCSRCGICYCKCCCYDWSCCCWNCCGYCIAILFMLGILAILAIVLTVAVDGP